MGKVMNALLLVSILQLSLILFSGQFVAEADSFAETNQTMSLVELIRNPQNWTDLQLLSYLNTVLFAFGLTAVVAGLYFIRNEWIVYAGIGGVFLSFGISIYNFYQYMIAQNIFGGAAIIVTLLMLPFFIYFLVTILDFTRGKD